MSLVIIRAKEVFFRITKFLRTEIQGFASVILAI